MIFENKNWALGKLCRIAKGPHIQFFSFKCCWLTCLRASENVDCYTKIIKMGNIVKKYLKVFFLPWFFKVKGRYLQIFKKKSFFKIPVIFESENFVCATRQIRRFFLIGLIKMYLIGSKVPVSVKCKKYYNISLRPNIHYLNFVKLRVCKVKYFPKFCEM